MATLVCPVRAKYSYYRKGEVVKVRFVRGLNYIIERIRWKKPKLPLFNQCFGVPLASLHLHGFLKGGGQ